jgi:PAS domain S-box-containing protein
MSRLIDAHRRAEEALRENERQLREARDELGTKVAERTAKLQRSEAYLAEAQKLSHTGSFAFNVSSGKLYWSEETFRIFECDQANQPTLEFVLERVHPDERAKVQQTLNRAREDKKGLDFERRLLMPDGNIKHIHIIGHPIFDKSDDVVEFVGTVIDITARRQAEEERQALAHTHRITTMGQLTASIAHEVSQPMAGVVINARAALRWLDRPSPDLGEIRQALGRIVNDGIRAGDIVSRIRGMIAKAPPRKAKLDLNNTILEVIALTHTEMQRNGISLSTQLAPNLPLVEGDRVQLQQVMLNLILNAVQALSEKSRESRELLISTEHGGKKGVCVAVRDSGPGLTPESFEHLFNAFYTTKAGGMGMGLSICHSIVEAHGGTMWAAANVPQGAVFQFALPYIQTT